MEVSDQLHSLVTLPWGRKCGACSTGSWCGHCGEEINPLLLPRFEPQTVQPIS